MNNRKYRVITDNYTIKDLLKDYRQDMDYIRQQKRHWLPAPTRTDRSIPPERRPDAQIRGQQDIKTAVSKETDS